MEKGVKVMFEISWHRGQPHRINRVPERRKPVWNTYLA